MKDDRLPKKDEKTLKQLIKAYRKIAVYLLQRIAKLKRSSAIQEKKAASVVIKDGDMLLLPTHDTIRQEEEILSTDIHDLRKLKKFESELRALAFDSGKEASWEYLRYMKKVIRDAQKFVKETEKKKEKRRREEEIKKYGKH